MDPRIIGKAPALPTIAPGRERFHLVSAAVVVTRFKPLKPALSPLPKVRGPPRQFGRKRANASRGAAG